MLIKREILTVKLDSPEGEIIQRALAAKQRVRILSLLHRHPMNLKEIAGLLTLSQPTVSEHVQILEQAGLLASEQVSTDKASEKRCWAVYEQINFQADPGLPAHDSNTAVVSMPIGMFTAISTIAPCGMASENAHIAQSDNPSCMMNPDRAYAQILWFAEGWVEYSVPCNLPLDAEITGVDFIAEMCSETVEYNHDWPSDITIWINGHEIGTWTSPGDFGDHRGRFTPGWWSAKWTQYGILKAFSIDDSGSFIDGVRSGNTRVSDLSIDLSKPVVIRVGIKEDAAHKGGINLFGRRFGNHPNDPIIRFHYQLPDPN